MRESTASGVLYHSNFDKLDSQIRECFEGSRGPGELPLSRRRGRVYGAIVPTGKYTVSGACSAWVYKELGESEFPMTYVILTGCLKPGVFASSDSWKTPFGTVHVDGDLLKDLVGNGLVKVDDSVFVMDYTVEVQLPFLQFVSKTDLSRLRILPLAVGSFSQKLVDYFIDRELDVCFVLASDLTKFGPRFKYTPFVSGVKSKMEELDGAIIGGILEDDFSLFSRNRSFLGKNALEVMYKVCKWYKCKPQLLNYYNSADITGEYRNIVGYAGFVLK